MDTRGQNLFFWLNLKVLISICCRCEVSRTRGVHEKHGMLGKRIRNQKYFFDRMQV